MKNLICIVCPKGCHLSVDVDNDYKVTGNACPRGAQYAKDELTAPVRVITSTVCIDGAAHPRCPVKTTGAIPKQLIFEAVNALEQICLRAPVHKGDVVISNICGSGIDFVATRDM